MANVKSQYSALEHLLLSTNFRSGLLIFMALDDAATLYIDDSGTHDESLVAVAAGYIVDVGQIDLFRKDWEDAKAIEEFETFHMADFQGRYKEFSDPKWDNDSKRQRTLSRLLSIARTRSRYGIFIAVDRQAYSDIVLGDLQLTEMFGKYHYTFAVRAFLDHVKTWRSQFAPNHKVRYTFDRMSKGKGEILSTFDRLSQRPNAYGIPPTGGYSFEDKKEILQLQAADILAWHTYQHMCEAVLRRLPVRRAMEQIMEMPYKDGLYDREALQKLAAHAKSLLSHGPVTAPRS